MGQTTTLNDTFIPGLYSVNTIDRKQYEEDLARKQRDHLSQVQSHKDANWRPCMHDSCPECHGTGVRLNGSPCVHNISCPCPKCTPSF